MMSRKGFYNSLCELSFNFSCVSLYIEKKRITPENGTLGRLLYWNLFLAIIITESSQQSQGLRDNFLLDTSCFCIAYSIV